MMLLFLWSALCSLFIEPFFINPISSPTVTNHNTTASVPFVAPLELSYIINNLKSEVEAKMMTSDFLILLQNYITKNSNPNSTVNCVSIESLFKRFTSQNTFSMIFKDLCNIILTYDDVNNIKYTKNIDDKTLMKKVINEHLTEDGSHWKLFHHDFEELGLNKMKDNVYSNDLLLYWFGELTSGHRRTLYNIMKIDAKYNGDDDPIVRYVIILMVEETGKLMFAKFTQLYAVYMHGCHDYLDLQYVAKSHSEVETGNLILREYKKHRIIFTKHIIHNNERINELYNIGRQIADNVIDITMNQNFQYLTKNYAVQNIWDLE